MENIYYPIKKIIYEIMFIVFVKVFDRFDLYVKFAK